jgi:DNA-binding transcriptional regulator YhcF (GntR family)
VDFVLNRKGGVPLHDQLLAQLEMKILGGTIAPGQRLPSVRMLARRLGLHANTVSGAYRDLEKAGHVELRRGAGVYVREGAPAALDEARGLDDMIRLALNTAFRKGYAAPEIRTAVERWLRASPPDRVVVVDPQQETTELVAHELRAALGVPASGCTLDQLARDPALLSGALAVALPYHAAKVSRLAPGAPVKTIHVGASPAERRTLAALPPGATVLVVSCSPIVLQFAQALIGGMRGDELLIEARLTAARGDWRRLAAVADVAVADALAAPAVREAKPRRLHELRLVGDDDLARVRRALGAVLARD